jgi:nucleoside-diphosphate-sugar epimerase
LANILVTGATGFIGTNLIYRLIDSKDNISIFIHNKSNTEHIKKIILKSNIHEVDFTKFDTIKKKIKKIKPDIIYHLAAYGVYTNQKNYNGIINTNVIGTLNLFRAISEHADVNKIVNLGSSFEYKPQSKKIKEDDKTNPQTIYGISKVAQTNIAQHFCVQEKLPITSLRVFNTYGPFENKNRLIPSIILAALSNEKIHINNPEDVRDFIFVKDVVEALIKVSKIKHHNEIFNIGTSKGYTVRQIVKKLSLLTKSDNIVFHESKTHEYGGKIIADISKSKNILMWKPKYTIDKGLQETYEWFKSSY